MVSKDVDQDILDGVAIPTCYTKEIPRGFEQKDKGITVVVDAPVIINGLRHTSDGKLDAMEQFDDDGPQPSTLEQEISDGLFTGSTLYYWILNGIKEMGDMNVGVIALVFDNQADVTHLKDLERAKRDKNQTSDDGDAIQPYPRDMEFEVVDDGMMVNGELELINLKRLMITRSMISKLCHYFILRLSEQAKHNEIRDNLLFICEHDTRGPVVIHVDNPNFTERQTNLLNDLKTLGLSETITEKKTVRDMPAKPDVLGREMPFPYYKHLQHHLGEADLGIFWYAKIASERGFNTILYTSDTDIMAIGSLFLRKNKECRVLWRYYDRKIKTNQDDQVGMTKEEMAEANPPKWLYVDLNEMCNFYAKRFGCAQSFVVFCILMGTDFFDKKRIIRGRKRRVDIIKIFLANAESLKTAFRKDGFGFGTHVAECISDIAMKSLNTKKNADLDAIQEGIVSMKANFDVWNVNWNEYSLQECDPIFFYNENANDNREEKSQQEQKDEKKEEETLESMFGDDLMEVDQGTKPALEAPKEKEEKKETALSQLIHNIHRIHANQRSKGFQITSAKASESKELTTHTPKKYTFALRPQKRGWPSMMAYVAAVSSGSNNQRQEQSTNKRIKLSK